MKRLITLTIALGFFAEAGFAQVLERGSRGRSGDSPERPRGGNSEGEAAPPAQQSPPPQQQRESGGSSGLFGGDLPTFNPSTELVTWDGNTFHITDNRLFQSQFNRYLNTSEADEELDREYGALIKQILDILAPQNVRASRNPVDEAFRLLPQAAGYNMDAGKSDVIANQIMAVWHAQNDRQRLAQANKALEEEQKRLEWNSQVAARGNQLSDRNAPRERAAQREWQRDQQMARDMKMQPYIKRMMEVEALKKANDAKKELSLVRAKFEFQALMLQLFMQRRFEHVLIATRFYRHMFADGANEVQVGQATKDFMAQTSGHPPTVNTIDSMAMEIINRVESGVDAFRFLLEQEELDNATKRLAETFILGEYLSPIRTIPREDKRKIQAYSQKSYELISNIEMRDYTKAEQLVNELSEMAKDFDPSKPLAVIETARTAAAMHLAKARNAAVSGDQETLEVELRAAAEIWPRNPALAEVSELIFSQSDVQQRALVDFDQLLSQRNYRQIYDDRVRLIAATSTNPEKARQLQEVLEQMAMIEGAILRAQEIEKRGDYMGAWESVERAYQEFPNDNKLNAVRADLTTKAADFVRALRTAEEMEERGQAGSSLAWFLRAQSQYPPSDFAREGIHRVVSVIMPDAT